MTEQDKRERYEERAAIREFDGKQSRPDAERDAWREVQEMANRQAAARETRKMF
jgi:hypothetical protein